METDGGLPPTGWLTRVVSSVPQMYIVNGEDWIRAKVLYVSIDGRVYLQREDDPSSRAWVDITQLRYIWES